MRPAVCALALCLLGASCNDSGTSPVDELKATTDSADYRVGETIRMGIENDGSSASVLASCCTNVAFYVDSWETNRWQETEARGFPCPMLCPGIELVLKPGRTLRDSLSMNRPGVFRLRIPFSERGEGDFAREIVSNSFTVRKE